MNTLEDSIKVLGQGKVDALLKLSRKEILKLRKTEAKPDRVPGIYSNAEWVAYNIVSQIVYERSLAFRIKELAGKGNDMVVVCLRERNLFFPKAIWQIGDIEDRDITIMRQIHPQGQLYLFPLEWDRRFPMPELEVQKRERFYIEDEFGLRVRDGDDEEFLCESIEEAENIIYGTYFDLGYGRKYTIINKETRVETVIEQEVETDE